MSNKDYKREVMERLLSKYNNRMAKHAETNRRIVLKPTEIYRKYADNNADIEEKQKLNEAAAVLVQMGVITAYYLKFSTDIEKIYLCEEKIDGIYECLKTEYGVIPQAAIVQQVKEILAEYNYAGELIQNYREELLLRAEDPRVRLDCERVKANLKAIHFMETNKESLYLREVSMLLYGDSKWFEKNNCEEVCGIIRNIIRMPKEEGERNDAVLALYHIIPTEQDIFIKGDWIIEWDNYILKTGDLHGGIAISSADINSIKRITVNSSYMMTIENKTSYQRIGNCDIASMYLGGFANGDQIQFLLKVIQDNPNVVYQHFGDIDVGGFLIHRHLCRATSKNFMLYCMGIEQLEDRRFRDCLRELTDNDVNRMEQLLKEESYNVIVKYMKAHNVKLEQEIISYYISEGQN